MLKNITRGGQTFLHAYRMLKQIAWVLGVWLVLIFIGFNIAWFYWQTTTYDRYVLIELVQAKGLVIFSGLYQTIGMPDLALNTQTMTYQNPDGQVTHVLAHQLLAQPATTHFLQHIQSLFYEGVLISIFLASISLLVIGFFLYRRGNTISAEKHLRGSDLLSADELTEALKAEHQASDITLATIPIVKDSEIQHFLITGSVGTGKTVCISELLNQARHKKQRAIIYDKMGVYTARFYRPEKDVLLNPLDQRCPAWNIWAECTTAAHFDTMAESLIPLPTQGQDPFWSMAARVMFSVAARRLKHKGEMNTGHLLRYLLMADLKRIQELFANTEAESLASEKVEKMALSVKAVLSTYLKSLRYLKEGKDPFSIRQWVMQEDSDSWIFITSRADQHVTLKPLISAWLDVAANAMMSLSRDRQRRIWLALDETDSLQNMPSIPDFLTQARQFGGCGIVSVQAISQFYKNFGQEVAETIIGACNTGVHFRSPDKKTSEYVADLLGEKEIEEVSENISYGADTVRDGVSLNKHHQIRRIILPSQLRQLDDLHAYLRLKGGWPITEIIFDYVAYPETAPSFSESNLNVDAALEKMLAELAPEKVAKADPPPIVENSSNNEKMASPKKPKTKPKLRLDL